VGLQHKNDKGRTVNQSNERALQVNALEKYQSVKRVPSMAT